MEISRFNTQALTVPASRPVFAGTPATRPESPKPSKPDVFFGTKASEYSYPPSFNLINRLFQLGGPKAETRDKIAFRVSKYFAPPAPAAEGKKAAKPADLDFSYGRLFDDASKMAKEFDRMELRGKRIAIAETNTPEMLSAYAAGLAVGGTMVPLNLLALQDESRKIERLMHMINGPGSAAFVVGSDPQLKKLVGFEQIIDLKNKPVLNKIAARYAAGKSPRAYFPLDKIVFNKLDAQVAKDTAIQVAKLQEKGITPTATDVTEIAAHHRKNLNTLINELPASLKIVTPEAKTKYLAKGKGMHPSNLLLNPDPNAIASILYTSGTSGNPKGVGRTHQNEVFTSDSLRKMLVNKDNPEKSVIRPDDVLLLGLPLFHIFGQAVLMTSLNLQAQTVLLPSLADAMRNLDGVVNTMKDYKVTVLPSVPVFLEKLVEYAQTNPEAKAALANLRTVISGGAALKKATYDGLKAINPNIHIVEGYGSSEGGINTINLDGAPGYVGNALPGVETVLRNTDEKSAHYGWFSSGGEGEILVRSPGVATHYVKGTVPEGQSLDIVDGKGYYHTGDKGKRDWVLREGKKRGEFGSLKLGLLQIAGRISHMKNFIKDPGGERRDPGEFEDAVLKAEPKILTALAIPFKPNRETEKSVVLVATEDRSVTEDTIKAQLSKQVAMGKIPGALVPKHIIVLYRKNLPLNNDFKHEAGYKVAPEFVAKLVEKGLVELKDKSAGERERTVIPDAKALEDFTQIFAGG